MKHSSCPDYDSGRDGRRSQSLLYRCAAIKRVKKASVSSASGRLLASKTVKIMKKEHADEKNDDCISDAYKWHSDDRRISFGSCSTSNGQRDLLWGCLTNVKRNNLSFDWYFAWHSGIHDSDLGDVCQTGDQWPIAERKRTDVGR
ncbi:hypothetical protein [Marinicrinis sediminis]|uniref:Uncharacterized protein n=1 Tax=Marinicrinis sediminis TaxID=1652465 RepID=A0ABW5REB3_9BACL